jgi:hypothetical protein
MKGTKGERRKIKEMNKFTNVYGTATRKHHV